MVMSPQCGKRACTVYQWKWSENDVIMPAVEIEWGPVTEIEIVKQKLPASSSTPESFTVPCLAICLGMIVFSRTDVVSSGLLSCCRFAGVKNLEWMIRVTTRAISAAANLFRAHIWRQNLLVLVILYRENIIPLASSVCKDDAKPKHTTSSP